ncbi:hypothetical protein ACWGH8_23465 [Nonomuraea muscovyensis]|jgi:hypothetical protein|uniref:Uncharacterized protein n=1 Tax=Nonomuraea muscovyensis TaxID=1124761 RepID=A0A7X0EZC2_9ACTN|nr:hypothetical protein [Nonomuraea muscovyensis]MBB6349653.1 hypothetical protein [Nonomuraea muscovyensis]MDF2712426.1 hypothetical protein [Nonomuraea muscovyensis]
MIRSLNKIADRMLTRLLPASTAQADVCFWTPTGVRCCVIAGKTYCR